MAGAMNAPTLINAAFLQVLWFAAILGAAHEWMAPAAACFGLFLCWQLLYGESTGHAIATALLAVLVGFALDTLWVQLGWVTFSYAYPVPAFAPLWIMMLWAGLGLTLNSSLRWLQSRLGLAAVLCAISAPLSYFAASRLGAVEIIESSALYAALSLSWAVVVPCLLAFARSLHRPDIIGQPL